MKKYIFIISIFLIITFNLIFCENYLGYLRQSEASFCMDECSQFYLEDENGNYLTNIALSSFNPQIYLNRFIFIEGDEILCAECSALEAQHIALSTECDNPVFCFVDPCEVASECQLNTPVECVSNYCGGCYADFYDLEGNLVDCYTQEVEQCDDLEDIFFGLCDMFLGITIINGQCQGVSGCGWIVDGIDYSDAFFETINECEENCLDDQYSCQDIELNYEELHTGTHNECVLDNDCMAVWGHCEVGLGGCHYAVNIENYPFYEINALVNDWNTYNCMEWVCDCAALPNVTCNDGNCELAYCYDVNPAGCFNSGCPEFYECVILEDDCVPSTCFCDGFYEEWFCTEDCGGGTCISLLEGDVNYDGLLNVADIILIINMILNNIPYDFIADINNDDSIDIVDIVQIINIILNN